ncbi:MAG: REP-associated tyrosine transposase [Bellilinea sp.]
MDRYRITDDVGVYFITFTIVDWLPVFVDETPITTLIDSLKYCIVHKNLRVNAYVIMPNHFHAVVFDAAFDPLNLKRALTDFRKFSGRQLSDYVDIRYSSAISSVLRSDELKDRERRFWQSGWHAEGIYSQYFLEQKVNYLHWNPCRKSLVRSPQDWRYSSAAYWMDGKQVDLPVSAVEWEG